MPEYMTSQISFSLHVLKDEYLETKTRYQEIKSVDGFPSNNLSLRLKVDK